MTTKEAIENSEPTTSEKVNKFLNHPFIKWAIVAYYLYPEAKKPYAKSKFSNKFKQVNGQRFLTHEEERILELYEEFKKSVESE